MMRAAIQSTTDFLRSLAIKASDETTAAAKLRKEADGPQFGQRDRLTAKVTGEFYLHTVMGR